MMRNHKIVSTVNATFLLGFVAQRIFTLFFHLTFSSFCYPPRTSVNFFQNYSILRLMPPLLGVHLFFFMLICFATDILAHPDKITFHVNR